MTKAYPLSKAIENTEEILPFKQLASAKYRKSVFNNQWKYNMLLSGLGTKGFQAEQRKKRKCL